MAARADISHRTARRLCWTSTRLGDAPEVASELAAGGISFDRAEQVARLPQDQRENHQHFDIAQLQRRVAHYRRLTPKREAETTSSHLHFQPSSDELTVNIWGQLSGYDSRIVEKAIDQQADQIIPDTDQVRLSVAERRAAALITICNHSLYREPDSDTGPNSDTETTTDTDTDTDTDADSDADSDTDAVENTAGIVHTITATPPVELTITVDARTAASTNGQTGIAVLNGPRIGTKALQAILCDSIIDVIAISEQGRPLAVGKNTRVIPRKLRKHILSRDQGCASDGCPSKHHLQIHHIIPISQGGLTIEQNLITLCWYHHQIAIHQQGLQVQKLGPSRIRLVPPPNGTDPPHTPKKPGS